MNKELLLRFLVILGGQVSMAEMDGNTNLVSDTSGNLSFVLLTLLTADNESTSDSISRYRGLPAILLGSDDALASDSTSCCRDVSVIRLTLDEEFTSDGIGFCKGLPMIHLEADVVENNTDTLARLMTWKIADCHGAIQNDSYVLSDIHIASATPAAWRQEIQSYNDAAIAMPTVQLVDGDVKIYFDNLAPCHIAHLLNVDGDARVVNYTKSLLYALRHAPMNSHADSQDYSDATIRKCNLALMRVIDENETHSDVRLRLPITPRWAGEFNGKSDTETSLIAIPILNMRGVDESFVNGVSTIRPLLTPDMDAYGGIESNTLSRTTLCDIVAALGAKASYSKTSTHLHLHYLTIQNETNLYIRQAYETIKNETNLEVK